MLERGPDPLALDADHQCGTQHARKQRVLGEVLEVAAAQRRPLDVDPWPEHDGYTLGSGFLTDGCADPADEVHIERRAESCCRREARCRDALTQADMVTVTGLLAQAVRSVADHDRRDAGALNRRGVPEPGTGDQRCLLLDRQFFEQCRNVELGHASPPFCRRSSMSRRYMFRRRLGPPPDQIELVSGAR